VTVKDIAREVIDHAPDDCSVEQLLEDIRLRHELELSKQEIKNGEYLTVDELEEQVHQWEKEAIDLP